MTSNPRSRPPVSATPATATPITPRPPGATAADAPAATASPSSSASAPAPEGTQSPRVAAAVVDLAGRLDVDPDAITVVDARAVTWPDSSLGCPRPGMGYMQVLTEGLLIVLEANGRRYEYHAGAGDPFLCETPTKPVGG